MNKETLKTVILEVLEAGDVDQQSWAFYENPHPLSHWSVADALGERGLFADAVIQLYAEYEPEENI